MTYRYPALARFMAAHWATDAVHVVPVFGERGALFEHWVFCAFYNRPLTIRRRMQRISIYRRSIPVQIWHMPVIALVGAGIFALTHYGYFIKTGIAPTGENMWYIKPLFCLIVLLPAACGWATTRFAGGLARAKRIGYAALVGLAIGIVYSIVTFAIEQGWDIEQVGLWVPMIWRSFAMAIFCTIGTIIAEIKHSEPD